ncbi:MAG: NAD kinase [Lentimicrobium sp.]|jgi:NAD+ kinase|nr:NAD kinase [Lentimicrobium sp.]MDD2529363.1 NAD kinase [Lentimicrobiaceae bacterium]MDD4598210.1 NAD kinase [Lentimicrobiaceae bacterium]MDY0026222.1 NAD kinase [Lentimicrobium sp.]HAH57613.1 NAD kinase [Bacteroidales bacterium]
MKVALFGRNFAEDRFAYFQHLLEVMEGLSLSICIYKPFYEFISGKFIFSVPPLLFSNHQELCEQADMLISVGGDGTILDAVTLVRDSGIPIMGVNLGRMGFLSGIPRKEIDGAIKALAAGEYTIEKRSLLHVESPESLFGELDFALNELTINKKDTGSMILVHVYVNDLLLNSYWADGLIVATPTGSTAYSLSCNGPIITPDSENFVITPIASHNLTVRPVVIPDKSIVRINVEGRLTHYLVGLDSRYTVMDSSVEIVVKKEDFTINLVQIHGSNFFNTIRQKLLWGQDVRFHETTL